MHLRRYPDLRVGARQAPLGGEPAHHLGYEKRVAACLGLDRLGQLRRRFGRSRELDVAADVRLSESGECDLPNMRLAHELGHGRA